MHSLAAVVACSGPSGAQVPDSCSVTRVESARFKESFSSRLLLTLQLAGACQCLCRCSHYEIGRLTKSLFIEFLD
jgi:hypothetical protein